MLFLQFRESNLVTSPNFLKLSLETDNGFSGSIVLKHLKVIDETISFYVIADLFIEFLKQIRNLRRLRSAC